MKYEFPEGKTGAVAALLHAGFSYKQIGMATGIEKPSSYGSRARKIAPQKLTEDEMCTLIEKVGEPEGQTRNQKGKFEFEL